jgi:hypothetical protein
LQGVSLSVAASSIIAKRHVVSLKGENKMFKRNEGIIDRTLRVLLSTVLLPTGLFWLGGLQGSVPGLVVTGFGALALLTGLTGFCLLYIPFGISTLEKERELIARCKSMMANRAPGNRSVGSMCGPGSECMAKPGNEQS